MAACTTDNVYKSCRILQSLQNVIIPGKIHLHFVLHEDRVDGLFPQRVCPVPRPAAVERPVAQHDLPIGSGRLQLLLQPRELHRIRIRGVDAVVLLRVIMIQHKDLHAPTLRLHFVSVVGGRQIPPLAKFSVCNLGLDVCGRRVRRVVVVSDADEPFLPLKRRVMEHVLKAFLNIRVMDRGNTMILMRWRAVKAVTARQNERRILSFRPLGHGVCKHRLRGTVPPPIPYAEERDLLVILKPSQDFIRLKPIEPSK
mmetsp:Transcript_77085/g.129397  ORF Transcript_77085/g.129397 Transcript_77085/m.129397 type:complete len:255 (+) Transcript_77085:1170-1934(+)